MVVPKTIIVTGIPTKTGNTVTVSSAQQTMMNVNIIHPDVFEPAEAPRKRRRLTHLTPEERMMRRYVQSKFSVFQQHVVVQVWICYAENRAT